MPCKRLQPSYRPSANSLTLVPTGTTEYIAAGDSQAAVPFGNRKEFRPSVKDGFRSFLFVVTACRNGREASLPEKGATEATSCPKGGNCGDTDMDWPRLGAVLHTTGLWGRSYLGVGRVRCGGGDNTRGGQPLRTFILRGREPIPRCCNRHPIHRWRIEWNAGRPVGRTSEITREPDGMFAVWGVKGPWGCTQRRGSYSNPQISQSVSRRSSARARETSTGGSRGCQSFHKGKARSQRNHAHTDETASWKRRDHPVICPF